MWGRLKKFNKMQQYADIYLLLNYSICFGRPSRPSSGVHKTVVAASGTDHTIWGANVLKRDQIRTINVNFLAYHVIIETFLFLLAQYLDVLLGKLKKIKGHLSIRPRLKPSALFQRKPHLLPSEQTKFNVP
jgi:hypothetical protein